MKPVIILPVKEHAQAKLRMSPAMTSEERSNLASVMFDDVVRVLEHLHYPVVVVTNADRAATVAGQLGWRCFWETSQISESASVDAASSQLAIEGVRAALRLPADIPLAQSADIEALINGLEAQPAAILVPSLDRNGTNALVRHPPDLFPSRFGPNSLVLHIQEALRVQANLRILENPRIALDLDEPSDILRFLEQPSETETYRLIIRLGLGERISRHVAR